MNPYHLYTLPVHEPPYVPVPLPVPVSDPIPWHVPIYIGPKRYLLSVPLSVPVCMVVVQVHNLSVKLGQRFSALVKKKWGGVQQKVGKKTVSIIYDVAGRSVGSVYVQIYIIWWFSLSILIFLSTYVPCSRMSCHLHSGHHCLSLNISYFHKTKETCC